MPTSISLPRHVDALERAGRALLADAVAAGLTTPVPTCPGWDVAELLAHTTMVQRWALAQLSGTDLADVPDEVELRAWVLDRPSVVHDGIVDLADALRDAPADLEALTFLKDAPAPREFWARRQAHETTMHAIDARSAALGRAPSTDEADVATDLALDGIDELLRGFLTRGRSKLFAGTPFAFAVVPDDAARRWLVRVDERLTVDEGDPEADPATLDAVVRGPAAALYLGLWNRGDEMTIEGDPSLGPRWRAAQHITWS